MVVGGMPDDIGDYDDPNDYDKNFVYEYDMDLNYVQTHTIDSGHTVWGIQTASWSDGHWWFGCYGMPDNPGILKTDASFNLIDSYYIESLPYPFAGFGYGFAGVGGGKFLQTDYDDGRNGSTRRAVLATYE